MSWIPRKLGWLLADIYAATGDPRLAPGVELSWREARRIKREYSRKRRKWLKQARADAARIVSEEVASTNGVNTWQDLTGYFEGDAEVYKNLDR